MDKMKISKIISSQNKIYHEQKSQIYSHQILMLKNLKILTNKHPQLKKMFQNKTTENQPATEQPATPQNTTTPPTVNNEALQQTGPHVSSNHTPNTIPPEDQKGVANTMNQPRGVNDLGAAGLGSQMGQGVANKIKNGANKNKNSSS